MAETASKIQWLFSQSTDVSFIPKASPPICAQLKSQDELRQLGHEMASVQGVDLPEYVIFDFAKRLKENAKLILHAFRATDAAARNNETITPAAQWLLDNHYTIDKNIQQVKRDFPKAFVKQLPLYKDMDQLPRIFAFAWAYVAYNDSQFSLDTLTAMVEGFQKDTNLQIGELWALPSAIRLILIENARRLSLLIERGRRMRHFANQIADKITHNQNKDSLIKLLSSYERLTADATFSTHLLYRLRGASTDSSFALNWLDTQLKKHHLDDETITTKEYANQTSGSVSLSNIIRSLKAIDDIDWTTWFESVSRVDAMLRDQSDFAEIDFHSRNAYRVVIEKIARRSQLSEIDVTQKALKMAKTAQQDNQTTSASVARYFMGNGRPEFEDACGYKRPFSTRFMRRFRAMKIWSIALPVTLLTLVILSIVYLVFHNIDFSVSQSLLFTALALFPAMDGALALFNTLIAWGVPATRLVGYEYKAGIPDSAKTMVVVPTMITSHDVIDEQIHNLEVHYLSNPQGAVYFALATDWADSDEEETPKDIELYNYAQKGIDALNCHYRGDNQPLFFLLHRHRLYNESEDCFMGWERKRGKLHELNLLLRGDQDTSFFPPDARLPKDIRFVMTLDSDTRLTPGSVTKLVGKLNHPLNRPVFDSKTQTITQGYGILQPRVTPSLTTGDDASFLQRVFSVNRGIDPYVFAVSDTYQDLLGEGTFTGKGLYDIDAFHKALEGKVEENAVLSHDLLEGGYARAAMVSDVEVVEDYPTAYNVDVARHHRWIRGDWQLLPYLLFSKNISLTTRWKMLDNLRRSLTPLFWIIASLVGWCVLSVEQALIWQIFLLLSIFTAPTLGILRNIMPTSMDNSLKGHAQSVVTTITTSTADVMLRATFLAHAAYFTTDAIIRTLYRLLISHRDLLEWKTSASTRSTPNTLRYYIFTMWPASVIGLLCLTMSINLNSWTALIALPFTLAWFFSPFIAWIVSRSAAYHDTLKIDAEDINELRCIARRTWVYYDQFTTEDNNFLPPDNFQEDPQPVVAKRTSPTNIGVYLLSIVAARDFGWISFEDAIMRIEKTLESIEKLEKFRGHLYNWYETDTLKPMMPTYVSTVDSGNLAGHLVTLSSALTQWAEAPSVFLQGELNGLLDVNAILEDTLNTIPDDRRVLRPLRQRIHECIKNFRRLVQTTINEPESSSLRTVNIGLAAENILRLSHELDSEINNRETKLVVSWAKELIKTCKAHNDDSISAHDTHVLRQRLASLSQQARQFAFDMKFDFLERPERRLLSIGYRVQEEELDESCYDLLASEARLSSLFAIAKGDIKVEHWFRLGRLLIAVGWKGALLSWSGSMFEYLMPPLVMREPLGSLLDQTNRLIVRRQIQYAHERGLPWGISEAAFNARDPMLNYQYSNFGVPSLGLQRGLSRNAVIAPYASLLAAQYAPKQAVANLKRLRKLGALGDYGYHDAVDFTPARLREGEKYAVIRNYYAHHHGMSILAVNNVIFDGRMRERFHNDPVIEATELLLQEKAPREIPMLHAKTTNPMRNDNGGFEDAPLRIINDPLIKPRASVLLSNGSYHTLLTANGSGYSRWNDYAISRFQPDNSEDQQGSFLFLRDTKTGRWWSATAEPTRIAEAETVSIFSDEKAEYIKTVDGIKSTVECIVASDGDGEGRRIELVNTTSKDRLIEITSYAELVLTTAETDAAHTAFARMFVETEIADNGSTIFAKRRKRAPSDPDIHVSHFVTDGSGAIRSCEAETDRRVFIGRGRSIRRPAAFDRDSAFQNSEGCVLDPIASLRCRIRVPAHKKAELIFWTFAAQEREKLHVYIDHYRQANMFEREFSMSWTRSQVSLYQLSIKPKEAQIYQKFATSLIYPDRLWRLPPDSLAQNLGKQSDLWPMAISGDFPIFLLRVHNETDLNVLRDLLKAHEYWRMRGLTVDLVILNERAFSYAQDTQHAIEWMCEGYKNRTSEKDGRAHIFTLRQDQMDQAGFNTLLASARIVLHAQNGPLSEQLERVETQHRAIQKADRKHSEDFAHKIEDKTVSVQGNATAIGIVGNAYKAESNNNHAELAYWNGYGGFDKDHSYVIHLHGQQTTPHPWINVIANEHFGFHVSAEGSAFTWTGNSRDYQLTPWANDPVVNRPGEALYIVDRTTLKRFSPVSAVECDETASYQTRHGLGYSTFTSQHENLRLSLTHTIDHDRPVRISRLIIENTTNKNRRLRLYNYAEWVLGNVRSKNVPFIISHYDKKRGAIFVRNPYHTEKSDQVSFLVASQIPSSITGDRSEFIGSTGTVKHPNAIKKADNLSNLVEAGQDPCAAMAYDIDLHPNEIKEICFYMGSAQTLHASTILLDDIIQESFNTILEKQKQRWTDFIGKLQVKTVDPSFDILVNGWLPYQAYACRIMARAAFYQASGAFGFRDQLQDSLSLLLLKPELARAQLKQAASRQFIEGDVQHWWLPNTGAGVRTLICDDIAWLGYGTALYVQTTGDEKLLDEDIPFLEGPLLEKGQHDNFFQPNVSEKTASLYEHCALALDLGLSRIGKNGLPLMLGGDWNDGMNLVGFEGKGESVWLGWFLGSVLQAFIPLAEKRGDRIRTKIWRSQLQKLSQALEKNGWDGAWYRRGFYDNGQPLGSKENDECQIDTIAQSWSVLSNMADIERQKQAMASMLDHLSDKKSGLIRLFWPPFDKTKQEPGYIKGYPPGIRENGGQYTHGAIWSILALAKLGKNDMAYDVFSMINPITHGQNADIYRVEPYVMAADIYSVEEKCGRGGWTWYTGSAGWFYRAATETILGIRRFGNSLHFTPCIPTHWPGFEATLKIDDALYYITLERGEDDKLFIDGKETDHVIMPIELEKSGKHTLKRIIKKTE
ncbi:GH36-type glycosyl hydrolase domain-containing protein [Bartonella tamiae]|uniref:Carbohydrate binding domain-containing protein n=1 Tax=Bartonella tamiae Th239 TaxID=1094558 RepID=J1K180_9HYPH|nr:glucoamylase family protein [Bartonella tamiae]EJF91207.1 hypothetical protein ME5_00539 [Bartonella tamiae Th239]EJF93128.1 hypothetical protein MEG_01342 [Bartonella tamiae Th307]